MSSTQYLSDNSGDAHTLYNEMRRIAGFYARRAASHPTVGPTMLVHEAWLRLLRQPSRSRTHYLALAARAMRHFVIDYVRGKMAHKRDGGEAAVPAACGQTDRELSMDLERALERLAREDPRKARVVQMRIFDGMEFPHIAKELNVSLITVKRDWQFCRAWLRSVLREANRA